MNRAEVLEPDREWLMCYQCLTSLRETHLMCAKRIHASAFSIVFSQSLTSLLQRPRPEHRCVRQPNAEAVP